MTIAVSGVSGIMQGRLQDTYHWTPSSSLGLQSVYSSGMGPSSRCIMKESAVFWCLGLSAGDREASIFGSESKRLTERIKKNLQQKIGVEALVTL